MSAAAAVALDAARWAIAGRACRRALLGLLMALLALLALLAQGLASGPARAQAVVLDAAPESAPLDLTPGLRVLEDPTRQLRVADLRSPAWQARLQPVPASTGSNFGLTRSAWWLQVTVRAAAGAPEDWLLEVAYPPLDRTEVWLPGSAVPLAGGDTRPFSARLVAHRHHVFPVRLPPGEAVTLLLRVESQGAVVVPLRLWTTPALWRHDQVAYGVLSLYFGLLGGLLLYNLLLFATLREAAWGWYVAFVAAMALAQAALDGMGAQFLWPQATTWNSLATPVSLALAAVLGIQFTRNFLTSRTRWPRVDLAMRLLAAGWVAAALVAVAWSYWVSSRLTLLLAPLSIVTMGVMGWWAVRDEVAGARQFIVAWTMLLVGSALMLMHNTGLLPSNVVTANALQIGSALEMVLLSFALGHRMEVARRFKLQAQARIAAERAMVGALTAAQQQLKDALAERELILDNSMIAILFLTGSGRLKWANQAFVELMRAHGRTLHSLEPMYLSRAQYLQVGAEGRAALAAGKAYERELQLRRLDGTTVWVQLSGQAVDGDAARGTVWVLVDISERKRLEQLQAPAAATPGPAA
jgi:PAS domain S-box-containing protein